MEGSQLVISAIATSGAIAWDEYVQKHKKHSPYHLFSWLAAIEKAGHWQAPSA